MKAGGPLADLLVLDLTHARAGPSAVRVLADWGARVIKLEPPAGQVEAITGRRRGADEQNLHRNKESLTLNLKDPEGQALFQRLVDRADVVAENFRPAVKHRLGVDYERLRARNPRLIYASISGFGQSGPYAERGAVDQIVQGMSGLMSVTGEPGGPPLRAGIAVSDTSAGMVLAQGILLALLHRERTGEGQWVQTSLLEAMLNTMDFQAARYTVAAEVPEAQGNDHPYLAPMGTFESADGFVNIAASSQRLWERLCEGLSASALRAHPDYQSAGQRTRNIRALKVAINAETRRHTTAELVRRLSAAGVPCGPVYRMDEVFADPQVQHLAVAAPAPHPELGDIRLLRTPIRLSAYPAGGDLRRAAPDPGADSDAILAELGLDGAQVAALRARGVV